MYKRIPALLLTDILTAIEKIETYTEGLDYESFLADTRTVDAVERNFEIIGEATNQLPKELQQANSQIPWHSVISFRNQLIHGCFGVDYEIMWYVINVDLPNLKNSFCFLVPIFPYKYKPDKLVKEVVNSLTNLLLTNYLQSFDQPHDNHCVRFIFSLLVSNQHTMFSSEYSRIRGIDCFGR